MNILEAIQNLVKIIKSILWNLAIIAVLLYIATAVTGCANYPAATQPRALGIGTLQPSCAFLCFATNTQTDGEGSTITGTGSNSMSQSATSTQSPTISLGANK